MESGKIVSYHCIAKLLTKYTKMKLSKKTLRAMTTKTRNRLALELNCSVYTVDRWIKENESNSDLTKARAVEIMSEELELPAAEILEETAVKA